MTGGKKGAAVTAAALAREKMIKRHEQSNTAQRGQKARPAELARDLMIERMRKKER